MKQPKDPKRVFVCSPLRGDGTVQSITRNRELARRLTAKVIAAGHSPYTPHLWLPEFLDETKERDRELGIAMGKSWLRMADEVWVFAASFDECSKGMEAEVLFAQALSMSPVVRWAPDEWSAELAAEGVVEKKTVPTNYPPKLSVL